MRRNKRVVVITGAASGIGRELCRAFASRNSKLGIVDHDQTKLGLLAEELRAAGVAYAATTADVRDRDQVQEALREIEMTLGPIDIIISSAGICRASTVDDLRVGELDEIMQTNFSGTVHLIEAALPSMLSRGKGHIVGISSLAGLRGIPFEPSYCASKAAVTAYLESLRYELWPRGIAVTTVFPGYVQTPLLTEINELMGADMAKGKAFSGIAAASRIIRAIDRRSRYVHFPLLLGLGARFSRFLPPALYDMIMRRTFSRLPIASVAQRLE